MHDVAINGMAVHPITRDVYLSATRRHDLGMMAAIVVVSSDGGMRTIDLEAAAIGSHMISNAPGDARTFRSRAGDWPVPAAHKYEAKARLPLRSLTVVDMLVHEDELIVAGISNEEFSSTLRRIKLPFDGRSIESKIRIYHTAHGRYETRAPVRAMQVLLLDGQKTLVAAYTCSPLVLIGLDELRDGAKVTGRTIGDMGNGQPLDMVLYQSHGEDFLLVTNRARGPQVIPIAGLHGAPSWTQDNMPAPRLVDTSPHMPLGPVGKTVMFVGSALHLQLLDQNYFVAVVRDPLSGALNLESLPTAPLPMRLDHIWSEFDFPVEL